MNFYISGPTPSQPAQAGQLTAQAVEVLQLNEGSLLKATVQRVTGSNVLLNINGRLISARTEIPLQARQTVLLEVTQTAPLQVSLRALPQNSGANNAALATQNMQTLLTNWGVPVDKPNLTIAQALFSQTQTINPDDINAIRTQWQMLPPLQEGSQEANLQALTYLHTNRLPVSPESLAMARHWLSTPFNNGSQIAQGLTTLQQTLAQAHSQLQAAAGNNPGLNQLVTTLETALTQMSTWSVSAQTPAGEIMSRLSALIPNLGTPPEAELNSILRGQGQPQTQASSPGAAQGQTQPAPPAASQPGAQSAPAPTGQPPTFVTQDGVAVKLSAPAPQTDPQTLLQQAVQSFRQIGDDKTNPLHRLASAISEALANARLDESTTQGARAAEGLRQLAGQLEAVGKDLAAVQLSNLSNTPQLTAEPYYLFPIPLQTDDGPRTAHLKVFQRGGKRNIDPENVRLALLLDLPELGEIAIDLTVFQKRLSGKILSGREQTHQRVEQAITDLSENLSNLGYWIESLSCGKLTAEDNVTEISAGPPAPPAADGLNLQQINVQA